MENQYLFTNPSFFAGTEIATYAALVLLIRVGIEAYG